MSFSVLGIGLMLRVFKEKGCALFSGEEGEAGGDNHSSGEELKQRRR